MKSGKNIQKPVFHVELVLHRVLLVPVFCYLKDGTLRKLNTLMPVNIRDLKKLQREKIHLLLYTKDFITGTCASMHGNQMGLNQLHVQDVGGVSRRV